MGTSPKLDEASRTRLREIHQQSIRELAGALSPDLAAELDRMALPFDEETVPSEAELRIAQAQLVGWLEGLFHGIQASLMAQQMAARAQLTELRQKPEYKSAYDAATAALQQMGKEESLGTCKKLLQRTP